MMFFVFYDLIELRKFILSNSEVTLAKITFKKPNYTMDYKTYFKLNFKVEGKDYVVDKNVNNVSFHPINWLSVGDEIEVIYLIESPEIVKINKWWAIYGELPFFGVLLCLIIFLLCTSWRKLEIKSNEN